MRRLSCDNGKEWDIDMIMDTIAEGADNVHGTWSYVFITGVKNYMMNSEDRDDLTRLVSYILTVMQENIERGGALLKLSQLLSLLAHVPGNPIIVVMREYTEDIKKVLESCNKSDEFFETTCGILTGILEKLEGIERPISCRRNST